MSDAQRGTMPTVAPRRSVLLIVSLCLNVALVVMIAAGILNAVYHARHRVNVFAPEALKEIAAPAEQAKIDAIIAAHSAKIRELREASRAAHRAAFKMFTDTPFDPVAFANALGAAQDTDNALRREMQTIIAQSAAQLSPAERQAVAEKARRRFMWWRFRGGHWKD